MVKGVDFVTVNIKDLQHNNSGDDYTSGYRIVYFLDNGYDVGEYCSTIEGFMIGFTESDPIMDDNEIPKFISTNDLLNRYLNEVHDVIGVGIYNINGDCIDKVYRHEKKKYLK